jgi:hypothetical protein
MLVPSSKEILRSPDPKADGIAIKNICPMPGKGFSAADYFCA